MINVPSTSTLRRRHRDALTYPAILTLDNLLPLAAVRPLITLNVSIYCLITFNFSPSRSAVLFVPGLHVDECSRILRTIFGLTYLW